MQALVLNAEWQPKEGARLSDRELATRRALIGSEVFRNPVPRLVEVPVPSPGPGEVLLRSRACGVCGSDVHMCERGADGYVAYGDHAKLPVVLGHEWAGEVAEVGSGIETLRRGDPVCVEPNNWCGACTACRSGMPNQCANLEEIGFTRDGGLAEYGVAQARYCWTIDGLTPAHPSADRVYEAGALVEPCAVAYHAMFVRAGGFLPGGTVAVFGAGPIGLVSIALARVAGAGLVIALEVSPERRALASRLGADAAIDPSAASGRDAADQIMELTRGEGVAMAVEAAGATQRTYPVIERVIGVGGKAVQIGIGTGATPLTLVRLQQRGASLHGSMGNSGHGVFPSVIKLMAARRLDLLPMITARYPLRDAVSAIGRAADRRDGKVMVAISSA